MALDDDFGYRLAGFLGKKTNREFLSYSHRIRYRGKGFLLGENKKSQSAMRLSFIRIVRRFGVYKPDAYDKS